MMQLTPQMRILVCIEPADFRCGIDGLARRCRQCLGTDPMSGAVFVFRNRRATAVKLLAYDGQGFWLCHKRLSSGKFRHSPRADGAVQRMLLSHELQILAACFRSRPGPGVLPALGRPPQHPRAPRRSGATGYGVTSTRGSSRSSAPPTTFARSRRTQALRAKGSRTPTAMRWPRADISRLLHSPSEAGLPVTRR